MPDFPMWCILHSELGFSELTSIVYCSSNEKSFPLFDTRDEAQEFIDDNHEKLGEYEPSPVIDWGDLERLFQEAENSDIFSAGYHVTKTDDDGYDFTFEYIADARRKRDQVRG